MLLCCERLKPPMSQMGLGRAKTSAVAQYVEISPFDALLENRVFYISGMYEFLHSQGRNLTPRSAPACLLPPNADIGPREQ
jgi:hypothetical protein